MKQYSSHLNSISSQHPEKVRQVRPNIKNMLVILLNCKVLLIRNMVLQIKGFTSNTTAKICNVCKSKSAMPRMTRMMVQQGLNNSPTCQRTLFYHYRNLWLLKTRLWSLALLNSLILSAVIALFLRMRSQLQAHCYQDVSEAQEQLLDKMQILRWRLLQRGNSYK